MIYEVKVSIEDINPVVWRKIRVKADTTLLELHSIIQTLFEWENCHLHEFHVLQSDGDTTGDQLVRIGTNHPEMEADFFSSAYPFDESKEKLSNWLIQEQDRLLYVYDFGDDWQHEIVLEKILPPDSAYSHPTCINIQGAAPEEDSRFFWLAGGKGKKPDTKNLLAELNKQLAELADTIDNERKNDHISLLLELTNEFKALKPWTYMTKKEVFGVEVNKHEIVWCSVSGKDGKDFGLSVFSGDEGWNALNSIFFSKGNVDLQTNYRGLSLSLSDRRELNKHDYNLIKDQGFSYRGKNQWPKFRSFSTGKMPEHLTDQEIATFCIILKQAINTCKNVKKGLPLPEFGEKELFARIKGKADQWKDALITVGDEELDNQPKKEFPLLVNELELQKIKKRCKRSDQICEASVINSANPIQDNKGSIPSSPQIFLAVERESGLILYHQLLTPEDVLPQIQTAMVSFLASLELLPRELWVNEARYPVLKPIADKLGISLLKVNKLSHIMDVKELMPEEEG